MKTKICKKCGGEKNLCEFNKDKYSSDGLRYRCRECTSKEYRKYYYNNRNCEIERQVNYQISNTEQVKKKRRERHHKKYNTDILYKIKINLRNRVKLFLISKNFNSGINDTFKIVGCTPDELKKHIESKFIEGMSWENYSHNGWHIDHIIPLSSANTYDETIKLCHYTNLQPLWCEENYKKGNKII
jgi:hypothetical protein